MRGVAVFLAFLWWISVFVVVIALARADAAVYTNPSAGAVTGVYKTL